VRCMGSELSSTLEAETAAAGGQRLPLSSRYIRVGPFQVDKHREEVTKNGVRLKLQWKVYQVLLALIEKQGEVVTREEIRARLWPADTHVDYDANVNTAVRKLRQALGDSSDQPLYIETIPRKGYCLVIGAEFADSPLPRAEAQGAAPNGSVIGGRMNSLPAKSELWITLGVVGLILAGMVLGAVITKVWIIHFAMPQITNRKTASEYCEIHLFVVLASEAHRTLLTTSTKRIGEGFEARRYGNPECEESIHLEPGVAQTSFVMGPCRPHVVATEGVEHDGLS
jgi:DNA-binding winged helix-turn-helix (wHTH) protein